MSTRPRQFIVMRIGASGNVDAFDSQHTTLESAQKEAKKEAVRLGPNGSHAAVYELKERYQATPERIYDDAEDVAKAAPAPVAKSEAPESRICEPWTPNQREY